MLEEEQSLNTRRQGDRQSPLVQLALVFWIRLQNIRNMAKRRRKKYHWYLILPSVKMWALWT